MGTDSFGTLGRPGGDESFAADALDRTTARSRLRAAVRTAVRTTPASTATRSLADGPHTADLLVGAIAPALHRFLRTLREIGVPEGEAYSDVHAVIDECEKVDHPTPERRSVLAEARRLVTIEYRTADA